MADTTRVIMNLTAEACQHAEVLRRRFGCVSSAQAVSTSLSMAAFLVDAIQDGEMPMVRLTNGELQKLVIPGLTR